LFFDSKGNLKKGKLEGMGAIIFQHEFWHLLGHLYIDHAKEFMKPDMLKSEAKSGNIQLYQPATEDVPLLLADYMLTTKAQSISKCKKCIK
jgi:peptide deformylase